MRAIGLKAVLAAWLLVLPSLTEALAQSELVMDQAAVKEHCAREWADDFTMQEYCLKQIKAGFGDFQSLSGEEDDPIMEEAFAECIREWGIGWGMVHYCAEQQVEGRGKLPELLSRVPSDVAEAIEQTCRSQWPSDYSMAAYCAQQSVESWKRMNE